MRCATGMKHFTFGRGRVMAFLALSVAVSTALVLNGESTAQADDPTARATLIDASKREIGTVRLSQRDGRVLVRVEAATLAPGFHGFHVHAGNACLDASGNPNFGLAGGHFNPTGRIHGSHAGDMPVLFSTRDGTTEARFLTDTFTVSSVIGRTIIVHAAPDNYANIPASRTYTTANVPPGGVTGTFDAYHSHDPNQGGGFGADNASKATGDAGGRAACGVIAATS